MNSRALVIFFGVFVLLASAEPILKPWPKYHVSLFEVTNNKAGVFGIYGTLYFDATVPGQRIKYVGGCTFGDVDKPCDILFRDGNTWLITKEKNYETAPSLITQEMLEPKSLDDEESCCLLFPGVGAVPSNFTDTMTYVGTKWAYGRVRNVFSDNAKSPHTLYVEEETQRPVYLTPENWRWLSKLTPRQFNPSIYNIPASCSKAVPCSKN